MLGYRDAFGNFKPLSPRTLNQPLPFVWPAPELRPLPDWLVGIGKVVLIGCGALLVGAAVVDMLTPSRPARVLLQRNTYRYRLMDGPRRVQYGITDAPATRCSRHIGAGKQFTAMEIIGPRVTRATARQWERQSNEECLRRYGKRPRYNKVS